MLKKRVYRSPLRTAQVATTRSQVLEAARELFSERGWANTTVADIAQAAGVSAPTVYSNFGSKRGLLEVLLTLALTGDELALFITERSNVEAVAEDQDPVSRSRRLAAVARDVNPRLADIDAVIMGAAGADAEVAKLADTWIERRYSETARGVELLVGEGRLRPGLDMQEAIDITFALAGPEMYRLLVTMRGWTLSAYEDFLADSLRQLLPLAEAAPSLPRVSHAKGRSSAPRNTKAPAASAAVSGSAER